MRPLLLALSIPLVPILVVAQIAILFVCLLLIPVFLLVDCFAQGREDAGDMNADRGGASVSHIVGVSDV